MHEASGLDSTKETAKETHMDNADSIFTVYAEPIPRTLGGIDMQSFQLLMGCGTIDPVNPSLAVAGLVGTGKPCEAGILVLELSPLAQRVTEVGKAALGDLSTFGMDLEPLFALMGPACPSLLLSPTMVPPMAVEKLYNLYFLSRNDGGRLLQGVRCYPGNPFKRVGRDLGARRKASGPLEDRRLESGEATELSSLLLNAKAVDMEWKAFILAWDEACSCALDADPSAHVMGLQDFLSLYDGMQATCRLKWERRARKSCAAGSPRPAS
jgi:hypothetical protein